MSTLENLVFLRHAKSDGNHAHFEANENGNYDYFTREFRDRPGALWELTEEGRQQAKTAGRWLTENVLNGRFDVCFTSSMVRAEQTAAYLDLPDARWREPDPKLNERNWGDIETMPHEEYLETYPRNAIRRSGDYLNWKPPGGESMAEVMARIAQFYSDITAAHAGQSVLAVCHGEVMTAARGNIEEVRTGRRLASMKRRKFETIDNTSIVWYTSRDPETRLATTALNWYRIANPEAGTDTGWKRIERREYTSEELLALAAAQRG